MLDGNWKSLFCGLGLAIVLDVQQYRNYDELNC